MRRILCLGSTGFLGGHVAGQLRALPGVRVLGGGRAGDGPPVAGLVGDGPPADGRAGEGPPGDGWAGEGRAGEDPPVDSRAGANLPVDGLPVDLATISVDALAEVLHALDPHAVVNCAGAVGGNPLRLAEVNTRGPAVLCEALRRAAPAARLVHLGSAGEYGATAPGRSIDESAPTRPPGAYGATKLAGTLIVTQSPLDATVLRVFNPIGPGSPAASLPGRLAAELRRALPDGTEGVIRVGDLSAYRDYIDVRDVARAVVLAAMAPGPLPRILNIAGGRATSVRAIADGLVTASGFRGRVEENGAGSHRSASVSWQRADVSAATAALGWRPCFTLAQSLADLWSDGMRAQTAARSSPPTASPPAGSPTPGSTTPVVPRAPAIVPAAP